MSVTISTTPTVTSAALHATGTLAIPHRHNHDRVHTDDTSHLSDEADDDGHHANVSHIVSGVTAHTAATSSPEAESKAAWHALGEHDGNPAGSLRDNADTTSRATAWTYGQTMAAAEDHGHETGNYQTFNSMVKHLSEYQAHPHGRFAGYASGTNGHSGQGDVYSDDNAWIGLALMQGYHDTGNKTDLNRAKSVFGFLESKRQQAGLPWDTSKHPTQTYNTCDEAPAVELALQLHLATTKAAGRDPATTRTPYLTFARQVYGDINQQQQSLESSLASQIQQLQQSHQPVPANLTSQLQSLQSGLYGDHVAANEQPTFTASKGLVGGSPSSYNEGSMIGANTLFYRVTGNRQYLQRAQNLASAAMQHFPTPANAQQDNPAFFNILARNLDQLNAVAPNPQYQSYLSSYGNWVSQNARNPRTGLFDQDGIGTYDDTPDSTLDQAALVQFYADEARVAKSPQAGSALT